MTCSKVSTGTKVTSCCVPGRLRQFISAWGLVPRAWRAGPTFIFLSVWLQYTPGKSRHRTCAT
jgi:hypothetical protein